MGVVTDASAAAVPGVSVTVEGPALIRPQTQPTSDGGRYRFVMLPPGAYSLTFAKNGFRSVRREDIRLTLQTTLTIDVALQQTTIPGEVVVERGGALIDTGNMAVGTSFRDEELEDIPTGRDLWAVLAIAPGFQMHGVDVGGSRFGSEVGYAVYGVETGHRTVVEGLVVNNSRTTDAGYFDLESFTEIRAGGSAAPLEAGGPGAFINMTVKSGGDTFRGDAYFDFMNSALVSDNAPESGVDDDGFRVPGAAFFQGNRITSRYDASGGVGGRLVAGKAWFFGAGRDSLTERSVPGLPDFDNESRLRNLTGKLTYAPTAGSRLTGFYSWRSKREPTRGVSVSVPVESSINQVARMHLGKLQWTSLLTPSLVLNLQGGALFGRNNMGAYDREGTSLEGVPVGRQNSTLVLSGGAPGYQRIDDWRPQATGSITYSRGGHSLTAGFEVFRYENETYRFLAGDAYYYDSFGLPSQVEIANTPNAETNHDRGAGAFLQDSWAISRRVTLNLGVRFDRYTLGWPDQGYTPNQSEFFAPVAVSAATPVTRDGLAPRLGLSWDLTGNSRAVLKLFAGRYYLDPMTDVTSATNPVGVSTNRYNFQDRNGNRVLDSGELGFLTQTTRTAGVIGLDPGIQLPYGDEVSAHLEREIATATTLRTSYIYKNLRDQDAEVDLGRLPFYTVPVTVRDVGADGISFTADDTTMNLVTRTAAVPFDIKRTTPGPAAGTPPFDADHHTIEFAMARRLANRWMLTASFTGTWSKSFLAESTGAAADAVAYHPQVFRWEPNQRRFGAVNTSVWDVKATGRYQFGGGVAAAGTYRLRSGYNWARSITVALPSGTVTIPAEKPANRSPMTSVVDLRAEKRFDVGRGRTLAGVVDFCNVLNAGTVVNFRTLTGFRYKEVIAVLDPRAIRLAARFEF